MFTKARLSLALAVLAGPAAFAAPLDTVRECAAQLAPAAEGLDALNAQCPGLEQALTELGYAQTLSEDGLRKLNGQALQDLAALSARYTAEPTHAALNRASLDAALDELAREQSGASPSWWDGLKAWLRSWLESTDGDSLQWLDQWLAKLAGSADLMKLITYGLLGAVLLLAIGVVVNELRTAGVFSKSKKAASERSAQTRRDADKPLGLRDLSDTALRDQPALLLRLILNSLRRSGRLQGERHLTHRELAALGVLDDAAQRERFARVAMLAETLLYGPQQNLPEDADRIIADGRALCAQLETRAAQA